MMTTPYAAALPLAPDPLGQQQQQPAPPSLYYPGRPAATSLSSNFNGPFAGRVPNFPSQYLSSLNIASSFETQPLSLTPPQQQPQQHQPQQMMMHDGQSLTPTSADGRSLGGTDPFMSNATIVSNTVSSYTLPAMMAASGGAAIASLTPPAVVITTAKKPSSSIDLKRDRHSIPSSILLSPSQQRNGTTPPTHPVPEFLCHLYSMLNDPALMGLIRWIVPSQDETTDRGGGKGGVGKIVVHNPTRLQDEVLGKYYRHSKYSSFQRQLNYFGFKKRLHGSKKGKMCPCSFVHEMLGSSPQSLLNLKRRPPSGKRVASMPNLVRQEGKVSNAVVGSKTRRPINKEKKMGILIPSNVSVGSNVGSGSSAAYTMSMNNLHSHKAMNTIHSNKNASWCTNSSQGAAPVPLTMPLMAQVTAAIPGNSWPVPTSKNVGNNSGLTNTLMAPSFITTADMLHSGSTKNDTMSMVRANNAVVEAKKSLARNFLKSQQEQQKQQQQNPTSVQRSNAVVQQQHMAMPAPNLFPNPFAAATMNDGITFRRLPTTTQPSTALTSNENWIMGQQHQQAAIKPPLLPAKTIAFLPTNFTAANPQANTFPFPTVVVNSNTNNGSSSSLPSPAAVVTNTSTNYLMAPTPAMPLPTTTNNHHNYYTYESHPQGMAGTPEFQFNELLSNLLSTALPPSDELFDDDMSAGNISDFGATALQVADDGMLLPP